MQDNKLVMDNQKEKDCPQTPKKYGEQKSNQQIALQYVAFGSGFGGNERPDTRNAFSIMINIPAQEHCSTS